MPTTVDRRPHFVLDDLTFNTIDTNPVPGPVPEPSTALLLGAGLAGVLATLRRRKSIA